MAIRNIVELGNDILRERAKKVKVFDDNLSELLDDMTETMFEAGGVGLAAPQVNILKRVCVISADGKKVYQLVNPEITEKIGLQCGMEGCLSIPNKNGLVERPQQITVKYQDKKGKQKTITVKDFLAVIFCHEIDHLDGILFIDKITNKKGSEI